MIIRLWGKRASDLSRYLAFSSFCCFRDVCDLHEIHICRCAHVLGSFISLHNVKYLMYIFFLFLYLFWGTFDSQNTPKPHVINKQVQEVRFVINVMKWISRTQINIIICQQW